MFPPRNTKRKLAGLLAGCLAILMAAMELPAQVAGFIAPDTVCAGQAVSITNTSIGGSTWYWNFCSGNANENPTGLNIGNPGSLLNIPTYITLVKQGTDCFSFVSCQGVGVIRYFHGTSFKNNPVSWTNLGTFGGAITFSQEGIQVKEDNGQWYGFVNSDTKLVRLNFGASLWNTPTATSLTFTGLSMLHGLVVIREGSTWLGFATCQAGNSMVRFNFGTSLANAPVLTNFGNFASFSSPWSLCLVQENTLWYGFVTAGNSTLTRIEFGSSLLNTPTGVNIGNPGGLSSPVGLTLLNECESTVGYWVNYITPGQLGKLTFPEGITGSVTGQVLGNIGNLDKPHSFSELFRANDTLYAYITNRQTGTLTRLTFPPCSNASIPSSTLFTPPSFSYNTAGTYNIRLIMNEGMPTQETVCKSIVVLGAPCNPVAAFTVPDTVCTATQVTIANESTPGATYYWNFCSGNTLSNPLGVNIGNPGTQLNIPGYMTLVKDGNTCYSFITNQGGGTGFVIRYNHGTSFSNNPVSWTNLGNFGMLGDSVLGIKIRSENGQWIGFVNNNNRIVRLNFGGSLANNPTATLLGPYAMLNSAHCIDIFKEGTVWAAYITCSWGNKLVRLTFGNSLLNQPVLTDLGTPGAMNMPTSFSLINENGQCYAMVVNYSGNTLTRLTFGNSLLNNPTGENLGMVCPGITGGGGIALIRDCENTTGFQLNYSTTSPDLIWRLSFPAGITGPVTGTSLGNIGSMSRPGRFSELFRVGDTLFLYNTNRQNYTITRLRFLPCTNASVPSSTLYDPPPFSYSTPGTYNVQLLVNEGLSNQSSLCKSIVVMNPPVVNLGNDRMICPGTGTTLDAGTGFSSYLWSTGATTQSVTVGSAGLYWVQVTKYGCIDYDTIVIGNYPVTPVALGPDQTICDGQSATFNAGSCTGCSYTWSNLTLGQPNIGSGPTYTTGTPSIYSVKVTSPDGCITHDTAQLFTNPTPTLTTWPLDQSVCAGNPVTINLTSGIPSCEFSWSVTVSSPDITGWFPGEGTTIYQTLQSTSVMNQTVTYHITPYVGTCIGQIVDYTVTVKPAPVITNSGTLAEMCSGEFTGFNILSSVTNTLFSWTVSTSSPDLSGFSAGGGSTISQQLFNAGFTSPSVTYTIIPTALGCNGGPGTFTAIVHPIPDISFSPASQEVCNGGQAVISLSTAYPDAVCSWSATGSSPAVSGYSGGSGNSINQVLYTTGTTSQAVTYTLSSSLNGCFSAVADAVVQTWPVPEVTLSPAQQSICSGQITGISLQSQVPGATFQWTATGSPSVSGYFGDAGNVIAQVLENDSDAPGWVVYSVTPYIQTCPGQPATANITVLPDPDVSLVLCTDTITTTAAKPFQLRGGFPFGGSYSGPGIVAGTGMFDPSQCLPGRIPVTYSYANSYGCPVSRNDTIRIEAAPPFSCGDLLNDVRDGHQYTTFQLADGTCWMKENLAFGTLIQEHTPQTDNCLPEFYLHPDPAIPAQKPVYQWDEMMRYSPVAGSQGICPPGWHVPTSAEWDNLLNLNEGPSLAAGFLTDLYLQNGFHAVPGGVNYMNSSWSYLGNPVYVSFFWTSTAAGPASAIARGMNDINLSVSRYSGSRADAFSVRCVRDD